MRTVMLMTQTVPSPAADRIRHARRFAGLTQAELAVLCRRSPGAVGQWEIGLSLPDETVFRRMARELSRRGIKQPWWYLAGYDADPRKGPEDLRSGAPKVRHTPSYRAPYVTMGKCAGSSLSDLTVDAHAEPSAA